MYLCITTYNKYFICYYIGPEVNIANGIGTIRALKKAKLVKVIITFKEAHLDYKFKIIRNIAMSMGEAINNLEDELQKGQKSAITGFHGIDKDKDGKTIT